MENLVENFIKEKIPVSVYVRLTGEQRIEEVNSSVFLTDLTGWVKIDEGETDRYIHAQNNYFPKKLLDENSCHNYKVINGTAAETTPEEKEAEMAERPKPGPTIEEVLGKEMVQLKMELMKLKGEKDGILENGI